MGKRRSKKRLHSADVVQSASKAKATTAVAVDEKPPPEPASPRSLIDDFIDAELAADGIDTRKGVNESPKVGSGSKSSPSVRKRAASQRSLLSAPAQSTSPSSSPRSKIKDSSFSRIPFLKKGMTGSASTSALDEFRVSEVQERSSFRRGSPHSPRRSAVGGTSSARVNTRSTGHEFSSMRMTAAMQLGSTSARTVSTDQHVAFESAADGGNRVGKRGPPGRSLRPSMSSSWLTEAPLSGASAARRLPSQGRAALMRAKSFQDFDEIQARRRRTRSISGDVLGSSDLSNFSLTSADEESGGGGGGGGTRVPPALNRVFSRRRSMRSILRRPSEVQLARKQRERDSGSSRRGHSTGRRLRFADEVEPSSSRHVPQFLEVIDVPYTETKCHRIWRTKKIEIGFVLIGIGLVISTIIILVAIILGLTGSNDE